MERLKLLLEFLAENPEDSFILFGIAKEYEKLGKADEAIAYMEKIKLNDPNYLGLYYHLAKLYESENNFNLAVKNYKQGITIAKNTNALKDLRELKEALFMLTDEEE